MLWSYISNMHKLWVLGVVFQARMDHSDYYLDSLIAEFKSAIPRLNKCPLYPSLSRTGQASPNASANTDILPTIFFSDNYAGKDWAPYSWFSLSHQRDALCCGNREVCKVTSLVRAMEEIHWEHLDSEYQGKPFSVPSRETKKQMKTEKNNPLTSPSPKAADALKFTRQGLPCSRQWGGEGGCSVPLPPLPRPAPRDRICMCNFGISIYLDDCYADLWYGELGLFPGPSQPSLCEGGSLVSGKQHAAPAISNPPTGQRPGTAASSISSWLQRFNCSLCVKQKCISLSRDYKCGACSSTLPSAFFPWPGGVYSLREETPCCRVCCDSRKGHQIICVSNRGHEPQPLSQPPILHMLLLTWSESWTWLGISSSAYHELHLNEDLIQNPLKPMERLLLSSGASDQAHKESSSAQPVDWIIWWYESVQWHRLSRSKAKVH